MKRVAIPAAVMVADEGVTKARPPCMVTMLAEGIMYVHPPSACWCARQPESTAFQ